MKLQTIEKQFVSYLETSWVLHEIQPFLRTYLRLLFLFEHAISGKVLAVLRERQKQLCGEQFIDQAFDEVRNSSRAELDLNLSNNSNKTREYVLNRMLFCAMIDSEETDFFYLTEPLFEFAEAMEVSPHQLQQILESEFAGFKVEG